jgi:hypothetical protein
MGEKKTPMIGGIRTIEGIFDLTCLRKARKSLDFARRQTQKTTDFIVPFSINERLLRLGHFRYNLPGTHRVYFKNKIDW